MSRETDYEEPSRRIRVRLHACLLLAMAVFAVGPVAAQTPPLAVAAASDLQTVLPEIVRAFENRSGQRVILTFGSSGNFFTQIQNGAPFDVFLSADIDYPRRLEQAGLATKGSLSAYATGRIVIWARNDAGVDLTQTFKAIVTSGAVRRIAIANPAHAPYGRAAEAALRHEGVYGQVQNKIVMGENISQAAQFAQSGNAQVGLLALSLALSPSMKAVGGYVAIAQDAYPPIEQAAVVVAKSNRQSLAREFVRALESPEVQDLLRSSGFGEPERTNR